MQQRRANPWPSSCRASPNPDTVAKLSRHRLSFPLGAKHLVPSIPTQMRWAQSASRQR
ncbi:hypothetical protein CGCF415_v013745 [Colletotrichum fructicola]|nr:hypothetical protein CGCF415_v013745 [Colletotrichum fructicola]KAF4925246.1 hypothetical protein CGCF245_v014168 [Colletotrichum fructicola]